MWQWGRQTYACTVSNRRINFILYINTTAFKNSCCPSTEVDYLCNHSGQISCNKEKGWNQYTELSKKLGERLNWKRGQPRSTFPKLKRDRHGDLQEDCFPTAHNHYKEQVRDRYHLGQDSNLTLSAFNTEGKCPHRSPVAALWGISIRFLTVVTGRRIQSQPSVGDGILGLLKRGAHRSHSHHRSPRSRPSFQLTQKPPSQVRKHPGAETNVSCTQRSLSVSGIVNSPWRFNVSSFI